MFNLEQAIADWRREMQAAGINTPAHLDELEGHLREEVSARMRSGLDAQPAFEAAVRGLGRADALREEFQKTSAARKARERRRIGFVCAGIYGFCGLVMTCRLLGNDLTFNERLSGFGSVAATLLGVYFVWHILPRFLPVVMSKTAQSAVGMGGGISGVVWMMAFAYLILPRFNLLPGELLVAVCWALVPMVVLPAVGFMMIDKSERLAAGDVTMAK